MAVTVHTDAISEDLRAPGGGIAVEAKGIVKSFGSRKALDKVSFELPTDAFLSIFGPNGAGKTTLLRTLATLSKSTKGTASVFGFDTVEDADEVRSRIGFISHNPMLYPDLTAEENLTFFAELYGIENPKARITELLHSVELDHRRLDLARTFSRGMTQRLSIARALLHDPNLIFLDEPYSGLDPHAVEILDSLIAQIRDGHTFVMVSHDLQKGFDHCSHALILAKGRIVLFDEKENLEFDSFSQIYRDTVGMGVS